MGSFGLKTAHDWWELYIYINKERLERERDTIYRLRACDYVSEREKKVLNRFSGGGFGKKLNEQWVSEW